MKGVLVPPSSVGLCMDTTFKTTWADIEECGCWMEDKSMPSCVRNGQAVVQTAIPASREAQSLSPHTLPAFGAVRIFDLGHPQGCLGDSVGKNPPADAGDTGDSGLIPGSGRSLGAGNGNRLQYSCLGSLAWTEESGGPRPMG